jgi:Kef-type K+ transport system membrane component KefB
MGPISEHHLLVFLLQLTVILLLARGLGELFRRRRQPAVTAELLAGILLGPSVLGRFLPRLHAALFPSDPFQIAMLDTVAWLGVLLLMLDTGLEIDFSIAWRRRRQALALAAAGLAVPFLLALPPVWFALPSLRVLPDPSLRLPATLFLAAAVAISAMPVAARILRDLDLLKTDLGLLVLSALAVKDVFGWALFTVVLALHARGTFAPLPAAALLLSTAALAALVLGPGRALASRLYDALRARRCPEPATSLTLTVLLGLLLGAAAQRIGIHALFGFFLAGVMVGEAEHLSEGTRATISQMVHAVFVPVFFASIGLQLDLFASFRLSLFLPLLLLEIALRFLGAFLGAALARLPRADRLLAAVAHTPGGMMEIVVGLLALRAGLVPPPVFAALVAAAIATSMLLGPWMNALLRLRRASADDACRAVLPVASLAVRTRLDALQTLARLAHDPSLPGWPGPEAAADALLARESLQGTALGRGLAIPHARIPGLRTPRLLLARVPSIPDWDSPDSLPVTLVVCLFSPSGDNDLHVQILSRVARSLTPNAVQALQNASPDRFPALVRSTLAPARTGT